MKKDISETTHKSWPIRVQKDGRWVWKIRTLCGAYAKHKYKNSKTQWKFVTCEECLSKKGL